MAPHFIEELQNRGLIAQATYPQELFATVTAARQASKPLCVYCGFDPTAPSLHIGNLVLLMALRRAQQCGLVPLILFGGATGLIGDPTGRTEMRKMHDVADIQGFIANFERMTRPLFDFNVPNRPVFLNNITWTQNISWLDFLRKTGVHFNVSRLLSADVNKSRLDNGLTFMEMGYQLLQAHDFLHLFQNENCKIQLGGNDQWSNILAGVELIKKVTGEQTYAVTLPLLAGADGRKYGKSAGNAIWLDAQMTSPYTFFQFFRNVADSDIGLFYRVFSNLTVDEINSLLGKESVNTCKELLAFEVTCLIHGEHAAHEARETARSLFGKKGTADAATDSPDSAGRSWQRLAQEAPCTILVASDLTSSPAGGGSAAAGGLDLMGLVVKTGLVGSRSEARKLIEAGGLSVNETKSTQPFLKISVELFHEHDGIILLRKGKKDYHAVRLTNKES